MGIFGVKDNFDNASGTDGGIAAVNKTSRRKTKFSAWHLVLLLIMAASGFLSFYAIGNEGFANEYYSAAVKSMLTSWHNFFFVSLDPGGYVSVDKPAMGLWLQAASAFVFGFHGWSLILPEALSTIISVGVIFHLVQRYFGKAAGIASAAVLGLTPILIAVSRTNNLDASLVMVLLFASWALIKASEKGSICLFILSMALVGLGFNIKMLEAYMVLPAFLLVYFFTSPIRLGRKLAHISAGIAVLLVVSLSWAVAVDLTPAAERPYVGSSSTNSVLELALGYNGIQRITGDNMAGNRSGSNFRNSQTADATTQTAENQGSGQPGTVSGQSGDDGGRGFGWQGGTGGPGWNGGPNGFNDGQGGPGNFGGGQGGPGGTGENGAKGILRIFDQQLAGQISWMLPMAFFGFLAILLRAKKIEAEERRKAIRFILLFGACIIPMLGYFSVAGFFHRYYLSMMSPSIAALSGAGVVQLFKAYKGAGWKWVLLPGSLLAAALLQAIILLRYTGYREKLIPIVCGICLAAAIVLTVIRLLRKETLGRTMTAAVAAGFVALLIAPAVWAHTPLVYGSQTQLPIAGPELQSGGGFGQPARSSSQITDNTVQNPGLNGMNSSESKLVKFLIEKRQGEKFLVAVPDAGSAESIILQTGQAVMAVGGFSGQDNILTLDRLKQMVADGELRYFEVGGRGMGNQSEITQWVMENGKEVPSSEIYGSASDSSSSSSNQFGKRMGNNGTLYDLMPDKG